jgi:hypothetical protein
MAHPGKMSRARAGAQARKTLYQSLVANYDKPAFI